MRRHSISILVTVGWLGVHPALAGGQPPTLDYHRSSAGRPAASRPANGGPPSELREIDRKVEALRAEVSRAKEGALSHELSARAREAGAGRARERVREEGRRQAYTLGFQKGLHRALDDPALGRWDYRYGLDRGRWDGGARRWGEDQGRREGFDRAGGAARRRVEAQFRDLSRDPRFDPIAIPPPLGPLLEPPPPQLDEVFVDLPLRGTPYPLEVRRLRGGHRGYDGRWWDASRAFERWSRRERSWWGSLSEEDQGRFRRAFLAAYLDALSEACAGALERAYEDGFDRGWSYGAAILYEWSYRQGFHQGWVEALYDSAESAYAEAFRDAFGQAYGAAFDEWSTTAKPEILGARLDDGDDDGVFEPGESFRLRYRLANYGGAAASRVVALEGEVLSAAVRARIDLPRRSLLPDPPPIVARIGPDVPPRTRSELDLSVAGDRRGVPVWVSYPLELEPQLRLERADSVAGTAVLEVAVRNTSRRPSPARLHLRAAREQVRALTRIEPAGRRDASFQLSDLDPLELLAGEIEVEVAAYAEDRLHDARRHRLPELATDLTSGELVRYLDALARREGSSDLVVRAQSLVLRRLRVDWQAAMAGRGNPYKQDLKRRTEATALGQLVRLFESRRSTYRSPRVFSDLAPQIERLADDLPGRHPLLRRSMKKLARQLAG